MMQRLNLVVFSAAFGAMFAVAAYRGSDDYATGWLVVGMVVAAALICGQLIYWDE